MRNLLSVVYVLLLTSTVNAQITLSGTNYTQNFDGVGTALPTGFQVATNATSISLGTSATFTNAATAWNSTTAGWKNYASAEGLVSGSSSTAQSASADRVVAIRQSGSTGDPGSALEMQLANTNGFTDFTMSFKLQSLDVASPRITTWIVDYGFGSSPTSFTSLVTSPTPITTGGSSFTNTTVTVNFGTALNNINQPVWIRIVALASTSGTGNRATSGIDDLVLNFNGGIACTPPGTQASSASINTITSSSFDINWTPVASTNSLVVVKQGSAVAGIPSNGNAYSANTVFGAGQTIAGGEFVVYNGTGNDVPVTGLAIGTTYHISVFSFNTADNCYNTMLPAANNATTSCAEPTVQVSTITITPGGSSASINWSGGNGNSSLVRFNSVNSFTPPADGSTYTANTNYSSGEQTIYSGTGSAVTVTGLTNTTTYYVTVYTFNSCSGTPDYLSTGNLIQSFSTTSGGSGIPPGYYGAAAGLSCGQLKTALSNIITTGMTPKTYGDLWIQYLVSDVKPREVGPGTSPNVIWDIYSDNPTGNDPYNFTPGTIASGGQQDNGSSTGGLEGIYYNREHSVPQSWFGANAGPTSVGPESDYFHVYPTDKEVNSNRGNFIYGVVTSPTIISSNGGKLGPNTVAGLSGIAFEPINEFKGDLARSFFYFVTRYQGNMSAWQTLNTEGDKAFDGSTWPSIEIPYLKMMLQWNNNDPVSQKEIDRNNAGYTLQGNRNPYIDHPEYVAEVWVSGCGLTLPVDITSFTALYKDNTVKLSWNIERADGLSGFIVERSVDGGATFQAAGNVSWLQGVNSYSYNDNVTNFEGIVLYRLKSIDQNFTYKYSSTISIKIPLKKQLITVYPNPATDNLTLQFRTANTKEWQGSLSDLSGRTLRSFYFQAGQSSYQIPVQQLPAGIYMLRLNNKETVTYTRFVISR